MDQTIYISQLYTGREGGREGWHANLLFPISHPVGVTKDSLKISCLMPGVDRRHRLDQWFSILNHHQNHPEILEKIQIPGPHSDLLKQNLGG